MERDDWRQRKKSLGEQREKNGSRKKEFRPWEMGWSGGSPGRGDHTHTQQHILCTLSHTCGWTHSALHRAVYLLMLLFKNAVAGRALNHPSASLEENWWSERHGAERERGNLCLWSNVSGLLLLTRFIFPSLLRWDGCWGHTLNTDKGEGFDPPFSLSTSFNAGLLISIHPSPSTSMHIVHFQHPQCRPILHQTWERKRRTITQWKVKT